MSGIRPVCKIVGDLSNLRSTMRLLTGSTGKKYYKVDYTVEVFFGQTALCAELVWKDNVSGSCPRVVVAHAARRVSPRKVRSRSSPTLCCDCLLET